MSGTFNPAVLPDFGATWQRGQQFQQSQEQNALAYAEAQREAASRRQYEAAIADPSLMQGLLSEDGSVNRNALTSLAQRGGPLAFQQVLPLIRAQQEEAQFQRAVQGSQGGMAAPQQPSAPAVGAPQAPPIPGVAAAPGGDVRQRNAQFAALRDRILSDPNATPEQQQAALARISAAQAQASGLPNGAPYREPSAASEGGPWTAGLPPAAGAVAPSVAPPVAPQQGGQRMWTPQQLMVIAERGGAKGREFARMMAPLVAAANPNFQTATIGGRVVAFEQRNPMHRVDLGPAQDVQPATIQGQDGRPQRGERVNGVFQPYQDRTLPDFEPAPGGGQRPVEGGRAATEGARRGEPSNTDRTKLRQIEVEAAGIGEALASFRQARQNASLGQRAATVAGQPTELATTYGNAALLAKGEALFNLGVLNGPDLAIIRRVLADPSTVSGGIASSSTVNSQIDQIETMLQSRLATARRQYGGVEGPAAAPAAPPAQRPPLSSFQR